MSLIPTMDATVASNGTMVALTEAIIIASMRAAIIASIKELEM